MNYRMIIRLTGLVMLIEAALLLLPLIVALVYEESVLPYVFTIAILLAAAIPLSLIKPKSRDIYAKEGFVAVALMWIALSAFGALPFVFSGAIPNYIDAFFETVSGFTTTGATILPEVESLQYGILFWRSFTHWIGGMGVLVFMLAIIPASDGSAIYLMRAEVPGPQKGKLVPRLRQTALILYSIYMFMTVLETVILCITGLPLYDAIVTAFATAGTGGFSVKNASIAAYNNPAAEWVIAIFMFLCGINYNLYYFIIIKRFSDVIKNEELKLYIAITLCSTAIIAVNVWTSIQNSLASVGECVRAAFFQVTSIMSTAGFATTDFGLWPQLSKTVIIILMLLGACAGSTAGGFKISRLLIVMKTMRKEVKVMLKPSSVHSVRLDGETISDSTSRSAMNYIAFCFATMLINLILVSFDRYGFETNATAVISCFNNVGPVLGEIGPYGNFSGYSNFSTLVFSVSMLFGRLEIMPMLILLSPSTWHKS